MNAAHRKLPVARGRPIVAGAKHGGSHDIRLFTFPKAAVDERT
ncbi:hypothetical protein J2801_003319 [Paraburkholderia phenoliruptrix]|nr:hypothetical protein [Paraburkholderia phenoliruptrix]